MAETTFTDHYSLPKPGRGQISWDDEINLALDMIDDVLNTLSFAILDVEEEILTLSLDSEVPEGDMLVWDPDALGSEGGAWINQPLPSIPAEITDLDDVDISSTPSNGEGLIWDSTANGGLGGWVNSPAAGGSTTLEGLLDVVIQSDIIEGEVLTWDSVNEKWVNQAPSGGSGGTTIEELDDVGDVEIPSGVLSGGEVLAYNIATGFWEPAVMQVDSTPPAFQFQAGAESISATSSKAINFTQEFSTTPFITLGAVYGTATEIKALHISVAPSVAGFTVYNPNAFEVTVHWHAVCGGTGGGSGTIVLGDSIPDVGSSFINIP